MNCDPDQPTVLMTTPTGSAAYQIGGSTIDSTFLLYDKGKSKPSWEKRKIMQVKLQHVVLLMTDEISMVGFKKFLDINRTMCNIKGTHDAEWGNICVLAVGDLYQLPPAGFIPNKQFNFMQCFQTSVYIKTVLGCNNSYMSRFDIRRNSCRYDSNKRNIPSRPSICAFSRVKKLEVFT